jgi:hypothetical protein
LNDCTIHFLIADHVHDLYPNEGHVLHGTRAYGKGIGAANTYQKVTGQFSAIGSKRPQRLAASDVVLRGGHQ